MELEAELNQLKEENAQLKHALVFIDLVWFVKSLYLLGKGILIIGLCFCFTSGRAGEEEEATGKKSFTVRYEFRIS